MLEYKSLPAHHDFLFITLRVFLKPSIPLHISIELLMWDHAIENGSLQLESVFLSNKIFLLLPKRTYNKKEGQDFCLC